VTMTTLVCLILQFALATNVPAQNDPAEQEKRREEVAKETQKITAVGKLLAQATQMSQAGNHEGAVQLLTQATQELPKSDLLWARLGDLELLAGKTSTDRTKANQFYQDAITHFKKAIEINPTSDRYRNSLREAYARSGDGAAASTQNESGTTAVINTTAGNLTCTLFPDEAPTGVANFVGLAEGTKDWTNPVTHATEHGVPLYDGTIFHRVIPNFMIQGGDPAGNGSGSPGFAFKNETSPSLGFDRPGRLTYANAGPDTNGSQFFITEVPYPSLNGGYTIFGQCDDASVALVKQIARMSRDANDRPFRPVRIDHITIVRGQVAANASGGESAEPANSASPDASVELKEGQTPEEVEHQLGKPRDKITLKENLIYVYSTVKVIFEKGKLVDVQYPENKSPK